MEINIDDALRYLNQAQSVVAMLSDQDMLETLNTKVIENVFWLLMDRLNDLEGELKKG